MSGPKIARRSGVWLLLAASVWLSACGVADQKSATVAPRSCPAWSQWQAFKSNFLDSSGRVIDRQSADGRTVSEGQAYAMLFALIANDRDAFDSLLNWTQDNLAQGDLTAHLPAWLWGQNDAGEWGVLDTNPASDADVWMAYALIEAGHLWQSSAYHALGELIASRVLREEVENIAGLGSTLLPAPQGFNGGNGHWRLNPSYVPLQVLHRLAALKPESDWSTVLSTAKQMLHDSAFDGFVPDWVAYQEDQGFYKDDQTAGVGSYDAIRVYLWAGMLHPQLNGKSQLLEILDGMRRVILDTGLPPEKVSSDGPIGTGSVGFSAALLPYLAATGDSALEQLQLLRIKARPIPEDAYYQQALSLFGLGWQQGYFRFGLTGELQPRWAQGC